MAESLPQNFNHLKIHTQYSICEGAIKIDDLQEYSKSNKIKSLGLCDTSNLCGALEFAEKISKSGTQPIIGTQINFKIHDTIGLLPLYALDETGYKNIIVKVLHCFPELFLVCLENYLIRENLLKYMICIIKLN